MRRLVSPEMASAAEHPPESLPPQRLLAELASGEIAPLVHGVDEYVDGGAVEPEEDAAAHVARRCDREPRSVQELSPPAPATMATPPAIIMEHSRSREMPP